MANYPSKNLTGRTVSSSYQNILQMVSSSILVDGLGTSSIDFNTYTASYSSTSSYALLSNSASTSITASTVLHIGGTNDFFEKDTSNIYRPAFTVTNSQSLSLGMDLLVFVNNTGVVFTSGSSITMPNPLLAGSDYGVYATYDNNLIATYTNTGSTPLSGYTIPTGYSVTGSRLIGGFYFSHSGSTPISMVSRSRDNGGASAIASVTASAGHGLITGDIIDINQMTDLTYNTVDIPITVNGNIISYTNSGSAETTAAETAGKIWKINNNGYINQYSLWDLKFRPACSDPRGMVLVDGRFWCDIYLTNVQYLTHGTSRKGERIADGENASSYPLISTKMGGNGTTTYGRCDWFVANEVAAHWEKKLLSYADFQTATYGTSEQTSYGTDNQFTCRASVYTSKWGVEQATGVMWVWSSDLNYRYDSGTGTPLVSSYRSCDSSSVAMITCSAAHGLAVGDLVSITGFTGTPGTQYNRFTTVQSVPSSSVFTYNCASGSLGEGLVASALGSIVVGTLPVYNYNTNTQNRGRMYIQGPYGLTAGLYGGSWSYGSSAGSRCSYWSLYVWYFNILIGLRCRCDHTVIP
jgi:hypothetical protein